MPLSPEVRRKPTSLTESHQVMPFRQEHSTAVGVITFIPQMTSPRRTCSTTLLAARLSLGAAWVVPVAVSLQSRLLPPPFVVRKRNHSGPHRLRHRRGAKTATSFIALTMLIRLSSSLQALVVPTTRISPQVLHAHVSGEIAEARSDRSDYWCSRWYR